jgi:anti-sigma factor RsiW
MNETHPSIDQIVDYLHGELSSAQDAAMHAHLAACRSCDERRGEELRLTEALRAHARAQERDLPPGVAARIRAAIERPDRSTSWDGLRAALRPVFILPSAAALAVLVYAGAGAWRAATAPTAIDAASYVSEHAALAGIEPFSQDAPPLALTSDESR